MKPTKNVIEAVREWAREICKEDERHLFQNIDGVFTDEERINLHICNDNYLVLEAIDVREGDNGVHVFLSDYDHDKTCLYTLSECDDFELIQFCPDSEFFTLDRIRELRRRIKDLPEIKADDIKPISDPDKHTTLRPDNVDIRDIVAIVHEWACDVCREKGLMPEFKPDYFHKPRFNFVIPAITFYEATLVIDKLGDDFDIVLTDTRTDGVIHVTYKVNGKVDAIVSGSFKIISRERVRDLVDRLRRENSTPVKNPFLLSPNSFALGLNKITPLTLTHDIIKHGHTMRRWCFNPTWVSPKYDMVDANKQYRHRIDYLINKFRRLSAEYGSAERALSEIPNVPLAEYCTHKFPIRRKLILPTVETIDGKTVMHFKVDDISERVIKKYSEMSSILIDTVDNGFDSKNSMFNILDQGTCTAPSDEVLLYMIDNFAFGNSYGIRAVPDKVLDYCSDARIRVLLNLSSDALKDISVEERHNMAEYIMKHNSLTLYGGGTSVNGILLSLMLHINEAERTLEHDAVIIDNSSELHAIVKITQLINMLINGDIDLEWMKKHKCGGLEIDQTLVDKVSACLRK